ncbi:hypothetical protein L226DRAFT_324802 [Lentinus tigrinus ALCF2SS1-7]|uniref:Uncharacterized protein n=1 Tax=Lentinus tigrinus ALCF2SS1-6 TaxID=1328759 RepID=A0A5C2SG47_9APHY|nr:hypothetical protein L227DRAFT_434037 [Lentinus tigrinus ALCF2SS1-6]RPD77526.1 hypothetical protein L226DRAFT_324802 [Lentinus tigrinus ALCF2SS1-7]
MISSRPAQGAPGSSFSTTRSSMTNPLRYSAPCPLGNQQTTFSGSISVIATRRTAGTRRDVSPRRRCLSLCLSFLRPRSQLETTPPWPERVLSPRIDTSDILSSTASASGAPTFLAQFRLPSASCHPRCRRPTSSMAIQATTSDATRHLVQRRPPSRPSWPRLISHPQRPPGVPMHSISLLPARFNRPLLYHHHSGTQHPRSEQNRTQRRPLTEMRACTASQDLRQSHGMTSLVPPNRDNQGRNAKGCIHGLMTIVSIFIAHIRVLISSLTAATLQPVASLGQSSRRRTGLDPPNRARTTPLCGEARSSRLLDE